MEERQGYPVDYVPRIAGALAALSVGWGLWWGSMFVPAIPGRWDASFAFLSMAFGVFRPPFPFNSGIGVIFYCILLMGYLLGLVGGWLPVVARLGARESWFWRLVSLGLLLPLFVVGAPDRRPLSPGMGAVMWAVGSGMIALAVWLAPVRLKGEPEFAVTVLWRRIRGEEVLSDGDGRRLPRAEGAFPVLPEGAGGSDREGGE